MLRVEHLKRPFLGPVSFSLDNGECLAVTGPSGSGKTLLLRAIADLDPNDGSVNLDGYDRRAMTAPEWRKRVAMVPAETGWWADSVAEHFSAPQEAAPIIELLGLPADALQWQVQRLSSGERQRLALARALVKKPEVLLLDEPTAALDKTATVRVEKLLRQQLIAGTAIVIVTHDSAQLKRLANSRVKLAEGRASAQEPVG